MNKKKIGLLIIIIGTILILYPIISNIMESYRQTTVIGNYKELVEKLEYDQIALEKEKARKYNEQLRENINVVTDEEKENETVSYINVLNIGEVMGYISIPKIDAYIPIYHGASSDVLQSGVGHIESTSLPIGEKGAHSVLAGHSGLVRTRIFDDIDKLVEGDKFFIYMFDETFAYEVDQIKVVLPEDTKDIQIDAEKEYVTLLTCTPYAINTHRLLVRGERIEDYVEDINVENKDENQNVIKENVNKQIDLAIQNIEELTSEMKIQIIVVIVIVIISGTLIALIIIAIKEEKKIQKKIKKVKAKNR